MRTTRFRVGDEIVEVSLSPLPGARWSARVVRIRGDARLEDEIELDARRTGDGAWLARIASPEGTTVVHEARVESEPGGEPGRTVRFGAEHVSMEWIDPFAASDTARSAANAGPRKISTPMPGRVVAVRVSVGETVAEGQALVVVEAMKMANELRSPVAGVVQAVKVSAGDRVEAGVALVIVQPA